ncbi:hypothetical protein DY000_02049458 [Brassica cretica]|uniref:Uncharacterized protein n=1 Tax=Brassica cretica TaxID=69181 RepID=A0ABQ7F145_BRACR|nr:hypothetical protein DY000_02049458 [Brassica cretica]
MNPTSRHIYVSANANNEGAAAAVVHGYDGNNKKSISVVMTHDGPAMVKRSLRVEIRQLHAQERARHHPRSHGSSRLKIQWDLRLRVASPYPFLEPMEDANGMVLVMRINSRNYDIISSNGD